MQLGFVIDHSRCIGCHACTVACKAENNVPLGSFRTWVKYTEQGTFPDTRRSFAVLRCNQCTHAPCVEICPVHALDKRHDGIVDVDPSRCIGCKACIQGCPYDALYINDASGTAEKCHFCAHRTELGLAPACTVICPTEALIPGDFDDPDSRVSRIKRGEHLCARKTEAGTGPNVWYREVADAGIDALRTNAAGGYLWANAWPGPQLDAQVFEDLERRASARTVYDVHHPATWGGRVSAYLFTKSLSAGVLLAAGPLLAPFAMGHGLGRLASVVAGLVALLFLLLTTVLLVLDLARPERFWFILRFGNRRSWLTMGAWILMVYGLLLCAWTASAAWTPGTGGIVRWLLNGITVLAAAASAAYTAGLFAQSKARVLWMRRGMTFTLLLHAVVAGAALWLCIAPPLQVEAPSLQVLRATLALALALGMGVKFVEGRLAPRRRHEEYERALRLVTHGPYARRHWIGSVLVGHLLPLLLLAVPAIPMAWAAGAVLALVGLVVEQDTLVRAGQAPAIS